MGEAPGRARKTLHNTFSPSAAARRSLPRGLHNAQRWPEGLRGGTGSVYGGSMVQGGARGGREWGSAGEVLLGQTFTDAQEQAPP